MACLQVRNIKHSDFARILSQRRQMNEFTCFCPKYQLSAQFGYIFSGQTDFEVGGLATSETAIKHSQIGEKTPKTPG